MAGRKGGQGECVRGWPRRAEPGRPLYTRRVPTQSESRTPCSVTVICFLTTRGFSSGAADTGPSVAQRGRGCICGAAVEASGRRSGGHTAPRGGRRARKSARTRKPSPRHGTHDGSLSALGLQRRARAVE